MKGTTYRRGATWSYRFDAGENALTGGRVRPSLSGFSTKKDAEQALRKAITAYEAGRSVQRSRKTVREFMTEWHPAVRSSLRRTTWSAYRTYVNSYVIPIIGETRLQDLTPQRLNLLYAHLLEAGRVKRRGGLEPKTVRNVHAMMHRALSDAVRWDLIPRNVAEDASPPRVSRKRPKIWTPEQLGQFVEHVREDRFYALWLLVVTTGFRRGELAGLLRHDVDLQHGRVNPSVPRVVVDGEVFESETKTASGERSLALDPTTWDALRDYVVYWDKERELLGQDTQLLFVRANGEPIHPDWITALFHKHCAAAGLPRIRVQDVRHSYATAALKAGIPPKVISERLGHSTVAFTLQTYVHIIPGMDEAAATTVADLILGTPAGHKSGHNGDDEGREKSEGPADLLRFRRSAGPSSSSGGSVLVQDIGDTCLKT
jgi:integrase